MPNDVLGAVRSTLFGRSQGSGSTGGPKTPPGWSSGSGQPAIPNQMNSPFRVESFSEWLKTVGNMRNGTDLSPEDYARMQEGYLEYVARQNAAYQETYGGALGSRAMQDSVDQWAAKKNPRHYRAGG